MAITLCPKCAYLRGVDDAHIHPEVCPACGIAYQKYIDRQRDPGQATVPVRVTRGVEPLHERLQLFALPAELSRSQIWARCAIWVLLLLICLRFMFAGINAAASGIWLLHTMILPFHEFGHVLFSPFGRFMAILGGSLFQVLMPLGLLLVFLFKQRDTFGASVMLWWCGESFVDLAPYIADAVERNLPLTGGNGSEGHDWGNLLTMMDALPHTLAIARLSFGIGCLLMLLALAWGAYLLRLQNDAGDDANAAPPFD